MKCPVCNGKGFVHNALGNFEEDCGYCHGTGNVAEPHTNEAWFCGLSTEEKAKWIAEEKMCRGYFIFPSMEEAIQDALEWLKQPHNSPK